MKKLAAIILLLCFLLNACGGPGSPTAASTAEPAPALTGVWVNAGQYAEGRDFVETLTLREDGTAEIHLDYQGKPYADLAGRWTAEGGTLRVDFPDPNTRDREYSFTLSESTLTLTGGGKEVVYQRSN